MAEENVEREIKYDERTKIAKARITSNFEFTGEEVKAEWGKINKDITITEMKIADTKKDIERVSDTIKKAEHDLENIKKSDMSDIRKFASNMAVIDLLKKSDTLNIELSMLEGDLKKLKIGKNFYGTIIDKIK